MASEDGKPIEREAAFPSEMQGRWVEESEPSFEVIVNGSEITWRGIHMDYLAKKVTTHEEGWVSVEVDLADQTDSGDALNLVAWPKGDMHAFNDHGVSRFVRATS